MDETLDWRHHQVFTVTKRTVNTTWGIEIPEGAVGNTVTESKLKKKTLTLPIPNASAMCIKSSQDAHNKAKEIRLNSKIDKTTKKNVSFESAEAAFDYIELRIQSVVMAYTAIEAFVNEVIPNEYEHWSNQKSDVILEKSDKNDIERWFSTDDKLLQVLPESLKVDSPKGKRAWTSYRRLKKLRDRVIHMKSEDRRTTNDKTESIWDSLAKAADPPHAQALDIIGYFVSALPDEPRWHYLYHK